MVCNESHYPSIISDTSDKVNILSYEFWKHLTIFPRHSGLDVKFVKAWKGRLTAYDAEIGMVLLVITFQYDLLNPSQQGEARLILTQR